MRTSSEALTKQLGENMNLISTKARTIRLSYLKKLNQTSQTFDGLENDLNMLGALQESTVGVLFQIIKSFLTCQ